MSNLKPIRRRRVTFDDTKNQYYTLHEDERMREYRNCRDWECSYLDGLRFKKRCDEINAKIGWIFDTGHREKRCKDGK